MPPSADRPVRVVVAGSGWRFLSGISYYTCHLVNALAERHATSALLVRRLVPVLLYPGRRRVGRRVHDLAYDPAVAVLDGLDWYWGRSALQAAAFLRRERPDVLVLQWWTGAVSYPLVIGGKPLFAFEFSIPVTFELTVLFSSFAAVLGMFALNGLPRFHHPAMHYKNFTGVTDDRFLLVIERTDPLFDAEVARQHLIDQGAMDTELVEA